MIESPVLQELLAECLAKAMHRAVEGILGARFGAVPAEVSAALRSITDDNRLQRLNIEAACCQDLEAFRRELAS